MKATFGVRLRQQREKQGISLRAISDQTKIKLSLLEGLERDDISHWPTGIFRRAYLRSYAAAIGMNPDVVVREFLDLHPEQPEVPDPPPQPQPRLRSLVGSALGSLSLRRRPGKHDAWKPQDFAVNLPPAAPLLEPDFEAGPEAEPPLLAGLESEPETDLSLNAEAPAAASEAVATTGAEGPHVDIMAAAQLCTELGRVDDTSQVQPLLSEAAQILDARGLIVWVWDAIVEELKPALVHGYSERVRSRLPGVKADADNATAEAFRSARTCAINGDNRTSGALVVPLLTPAGCAGVLALELPPGWEQVKTVRATATFIAAMLAQLVCVATGDDALPPAPAEAGQHL